MRRLTVATVAFAAVLAGTAHASIRPHPAPPPDDTIVATLSPAGLVLAVMGMAIVAFTMLPAVTDRIARRRDPDPAPR